MVALQGTGVSPGIASGKLFYYKRDNSEIPAYTVTDTDSELHRWQNAAKKAYDELGMLAQSAHEEAGYEAAMLFETHQLMLEDLDYTDRITDLILNEKKNAEVAITIAADEFAQMFASMDDEYMKARSVDVVDISKRLTAILTNTKPQSVSTTEPVIIAADDLTPSETVQLDKSMILGFILSEGNANSHTAILARTLGIPAIINTDGELKSEYEGRKVIMDGSVGYIVIDPDDATKEYMEKKRKEERAVRDMLNRLKGKSDVTLDGKNIRVYANITHPTDTDAVIANDAKGIGLFRSEFLYLGADDFPDEETQFEAYKSVVEKMAGSPVIIRTMDIGADKKIGYFNLADEENPALGMRALRICLTRTDVFKPQLRALYRASAYGKLSIMLPMVSSLWEIQEVKRLCSVVKKELKHERIAYDDALELGIMIETPAAVMIAEELAKEVSFFSIGTNDLTQYTTAIDRQGVAGLERFYDAHHPAIMRMIKMTVDAAHKAGIWAGICGEIAADATLTETFLRMGIDELSVSPNSILPIRNAVRHTDLSI